jgi:hypothetical protein
MHPAEDPTDPAAEADAEAKATPDRSRENMPCWALFLAALPLLYVLSMGPVALMAEKTRLPSRPVKAFYTPLIWLHDHTFLKQPLEWYVGLWGVK